MNRKKVIKFLGSFIGPVALIIIITIPIGPLTGGLGIIQPIGGIFDSGVILNEPVQQTISLTGLDSPVEVIIDHWGIPHIYAESERDAFMALGYMHAKERLFQMIMQNHLAAGRISELVGGFANSSDKFYRTIGLSRSAQQTLDWFVANDENEDVAHALELIDAEVAGVNAYIDSLTHTTMPMEFKILGASPRHWTRHDVFLWSKMMTWGLSGNFRDIQRLWIKNTMNNDTMFNELFPDLMPYTVPIIPDGEQTNLSLTEYPDAPGEYTVTTTPVISSTEASISDVTPEKLEVLMNFFDEVIKPLGEMEIVGSNNWVVHGNRTSTGMPILANDPHLGFQAPSLWYEAHIVVPGKLDVSGVTLPGTPGILLGHTAHMAWGFTNVGADVLDIFDEQINPSNPDEYMYNGEYREMIEHDETIHTAEGIDIPFTVYETVHGPIIDSVINMYDMDFYSLAMNWTGSGVTHEILALTLLNRANDIEDYHDAMYWWDSPPQNIIYADDEGNIAITVAGRFPIRSGYTGEFPVIATDDSIGMVSYIPFAHIPRSVNPSQGYLQSCNQRPISPSEYAYELLGPFADGYRGRRIEFLLANDDSITVEDMMRFQGDAYEVRAQEIVPYVIDAWEDSGEENDTVYSAVQLLEDWDYVMDTDSAAPTVWYFLLQAIHLKTFGELNEKDNRVMLSRTPVLEYLVKENIGFYFDDHSTQDVVETREEILVDALHETVDYLVENLGEVNEDWIYGDYHKVYIDHLLGLTHIGGDPHRGQNTLLAASGLNVRGGPSWRMVADLSNIAQSYGVYPGGQSGNMFSEHWADIYDLWIDFDEVSETYGYHLMYFYQSADAFRSADTEDNLIERTMIFNP